MIRGHAFAEVEINGDWVLVDPDTRRISFNPSKEWDYFEIFGIGLDPHDFGSTSFGEMKRIFLAHRESYNKEDRKELNN